MHIPSCPLPPLSAPKDLRDCGDGRDLVRRDVSLSLGHVNPHPLLPPSTPRGLVVHRDGSSQGREVEAGPELKDRGLSVPNPSDGLTGPDLKLVPGAEKFTELIWGSGPVGIGPHPYYYP